MLCRLPSPKYRVLPAHIEYFRRYGAARTESHFGARMLMKDGRCANGSVGLVTLVFNVFACETAC